MCTTPFHNASELYIMYQVHEKQNTHFKNYYIESRIDQDFDRPSNSKAFSEDFVHLHRILILLQAEPS